MQSTQASGVCVCVYGGEGSFAHPLCVLKGRPHFKLPVSQRWSRPVAAERGLLPGGVPHKGSQSKLWHFEAMWQARSSLRSGAH